MSDHSTPATPDTRDLAGPAWTNGARPANGINGASKGSLTVGSLASPGAPALGPPTSTSAVPLPSHKTWEELKRFLFLEERWITHAIGVWLIAVLCSTLAFGFVAHEVASLQAPEVDAQGRHFVRGVIPGEKIYLVNRSVIDPSKAFGGRNQLLFILTGVDSGEYIGNTDTILLTLLDFRTNTIKLLSIPRDTWVKMPGGAWNRINAAAMYGARKHGRLGGLELSVEEFTGVEVDNVIAVNYEGFKQVIDALGGVDIVVEKRMKYDDRRGHLHIDFEPGLQHLDGQKAMEYVRFRHDQEGDFARIRRQQNFLKELKRQALNQLTLSKIGNLVPALQNAVELQDELSYDQVKALIVFAQQVDLESISAETLPTVGRMTSYGASIQKPLYDDAREMLSLYFGDPRPELVGPPLPPNEEPF